MTGPLILSACRGPVAAGRCTRTQAMGWTGLITGAGPAMLTSETTATTRCCTFINIRTPHRAAAGCLHVSGRGPESINRCLPEWPYFDLLTYYGSRIVFRRLLGRRKSPLGLC